MGGYRRFCVQCGSEVKQDARFCAHCGHAAANGPRPAGAAEHEAAMHNLPVPPPSPVWDGSAVPPDGAPFPAHGAPYQPAGSRIPPGHSEGPPGSFGYARRDATPPPAAPGFPPPPGPAPGSAELALPAPLPAPTVATRPAGSPPGAGGSPQAGTDTARFPRTGTAEFPQSGTAQFPQSGTAQFPQSGTAQFPQSGTAQFPQSGTAQFPQSGTAQFPQTWINDVGFSPRWEPAPPAGADAVGGERPRPRKLLAAGLFALVAAVIVVPALLIAHSFPSITGGGTAAPQPTAAHSAPGGGTAAPTQRDAAASLATLLAQTAADRSSIVAAVGSVEHCTAALGQAPQVFQNSAASRQRLLQQLAALPGRSALPAPMLEALTGAWQASATVDADLAKWAQDEAARGCKPNDHADASYQAASGPDGQATTDKTAFVGRWNAIAAKYGLPRYQTSQL